MSDQKRNLGNVNNIVGAIGGIVGARTSNNIDNTRSTPTVLLLKRASTRRLQTICRARQYDDPK